MKISKSAIAPIVTAIFLAISYVSGHKISNSIQDDVSTIAAAALSLGVTVWGIFKDHSVKETLKTVATKTEETAKAVETAAETVVNDAPPSTEGDVKQ